MFFRPNVLVLRHRGEQRGRQQQQQQQQQDPKDRNLKEKPETSVDGKHQFFSSLICSTESIVKGCHTRYVNSSSFILI